MNIFKRLFTMGKAEAHSAIDQLEDPIKLTEQGIRDMKEDLNKSLEGLAQVKALAIRSRNEAQDAREKARDYEAKAMLLLKRGQKGELEATEVERLAKEALTKQAENNTHAEKLTEDQHRFEAQVSQLDTNVKMIRSNISKWENELRTLRARVRVSSATKNLNKQLAQIDGNSTVAMLERMKDKVLQDEALAESYGEIANESRSVDEEINKALDNRSVDADDALAALKAKMGLSAPTDGGEAGNG